jgi:hypothetical protein
VANRVGPPDRRLKDAVCDLRVIQLGVTLAQGVVLLVAAFDHARLLARGERF